MAGWVVYYINIVRLNYEKKWAFLIQIYLLLLLTFVKVLQGKQNVIADILLQLPSTSLFFTIIYLFSSYALLFCKKVVADEFLLVCTIEYSF